eukprot:1095438-Pyramimonas_sp.AAC.1
MRRRRTPVWQVEGGRSSTSCKAWSRLSASHVAVCRQGVYIEYSVEYSVEYSKRRALNGIPVSTVDDCRLLS